MNIKLPNPPQALKHSLRRMLSFVSVLASVVLVTACNSDSASTSAATISSASTDQSISQQEAVALVQNQSSTAEPSSIATLVLQGSETEEPFGL